MDNGGWKLREVRERLNLTYRDVEEASRHIASTKNDAEYVVTISRLSDIENNNVVPSIYRLYSLCVIYRIGVSEAMLWFGVDLGSFHKDAALFSSTKTHLLPYSLEGHQDVEMPIRLDPGFNLQRTSYLSRLIQAWGTMPLAMLHQLDVRKYRYGYVGLEDWTMYPLIMPGSLVQIDPEKRKVETQTWNNEFERPIYFLETRECYFCSWLTPMGRGEVLVQPYSLSPCKATVVAMPEKANVVGQVTAVAMRLAGSPAGKARATGDQ